MKKIQLFILAFFAVGGLLFATVKTPAFADRKPADKKVVIEVVEDIPAADIEDGEVALAAGADGQLHGNEHYAQALNLIPAGCIAAIAVILLASWHRHRKEANKQLQSKTHYSVRK